MSDLSEKLSHYLKAIKELSEAEEHCDYDRGHFLQSERDRVKCAEAEFINELLERLEARKREIEAD